MCKSNNILNYSPIIDLNIKKNIEVYNVIDTQLQQTLNYLATLSAKELPTINPYLLLWIEQQLTSNNNLSVQSVGASIVKQVEDNIYNFSMAKQSKLLEGFRTIEKAGVENSVDMKQSFANVMFNTHQETENLHVNKNSKNINTIANVDGKLLEYVSERDNRVRPEHAKADGTILPESDPWWNKAFSLMSEWNCRCEILVADEGSSMTKVPKITPLTGQAVPADIDIETGKAILFKKELDVFQDVPVVVRNQFRKNGF
jgi:hypothetical protein